MLPNMKKNQDGSLTLYIQKDSPGADKESNWLPAPNDTIYPAMRLYWPKTEPICLFSCCASIVSRLLSCYHICCTFSTRT
jgi:hypothetical protein